MSTEEKSPLDIDEKDDGFVKIAKQFGRHYYDTFDSNRTNLAALYRDNSMLTFESEAFLGASNIVEKLAGLPLGEVRHKINTLDAQPSSESGGIILLITGGLQTIGEQHVLGFTQTFQLLPDGAGSYFVFNDMFKFMFGAG